MMENNFLRRFNYFYLLAILFLGLSLVLIFLLNQAGSRNHALKLVASDVVLADGEKNHQQAIALYQSLDRDNPFIRVRVMRRHWLLALSIFQRRQNQQGTLPGLHEDPESLDKELAAHLFTLQQTGASLLNQKLTPAIVWRVHNLLGASFLLQALECFANEQNLKRNQARLALAIDHFKEAITWVDRDPEARAMSNIPRWNLELLSTQKNIFALVMMQPGRDSKFDLKKNLATMLPESAGFMVGEPPDSRIRK